MGSVFPETIIVFLLVCITALWGRRVNPANLYRITLPNACSLTASQPPHISAAVLLAGRAEREIQLD